MSKAGGPLEDAERTFTQDLISIGRDAANVLPLVDPLVSKAHAKIERRDRAYYITDLKSTNSTFVNGEKLVPGREYPLHQGDKAKIADFDIEFIVVDVPQPREAKPGAIGRVAEPFPAIDVSEGPGKLGIDVTDTEYVQRWSKLKGDIAKYLESFNVDELAARHEQLRRQYYALSEENRRLKEQLADAVKDAEAGGSEITGVVQAPDQFRVSQMTSTLLNLLLKLSSGHSSFLSEFIVRTVVQSAEGVPRRLQSEAEALRYFADPSMNEAESTARLAGLKRTAEQIIFHMMGLLDGYRNSVDEGTRRLLQRIDPDRLRRELENSKIELGPLKIPLRVIPVLLDLKVLKLLRRKHQELLHEDRGVLEKQIFRPGFIRGYEECVDSAQRRSESPSTGADRHRGAGR